MDTISTQLVPDPQWLLARCRRLQLDCMCLEVVRRYVPLAYRSPDSIQHLWVDGIMNRLQNAIPAMRLVGERYFADRLAELFGEERRVYAIEKLRGICLHQHLYNWVVHTGRTLQQLEAPFDTLSSPALQAYLDEVWRQHSTVHDWLQDKALAEVMAATAPPASPAKPTWLSNRVPTPHKPVGNPLITVASLFAFFGGTGALRREKKP